MKRAKKDRPKAGTFEQSRPGLAPRNFYMSIISNSRQNASPIWTGEGVPSPCPGDSRLRSSGPLGWWAGSPG